MKKKIKQKRGITLIALIIIIIILLILAGVSLLMLAGENGILNRARQAKEQNERAIEEEQEKLAVFENWLNGNEEVTPERGNSGLIVSNKIVTNYTMQDLEWELFYIGEDRIYLISKTYVTCTGANDSNYSRNS